MTIKRLKELIKDIPDDTVVQVKLTVPTFFNKKDWESDRIVELYSSTMKKFTLFSEISYNYIEY